MWELLAGETPFGDVPNLGPNRCCAYTLHEIRVVQIMYTNYMKYAKRHPPFGDVPNLGPR
jgi:hypothetical protein